RLPSSQFASSVHPKSHKLIKQCMSDTQSSSSEHPWAEDAWMMDACGSAGVSRGESPGSPPHAPLLKAQARSACIAVWRGYMFELCARRGLIYIAPRERRLGRRT